jgi:wobble nucleotide-excising tRNase
VYKFTAWLQRLPARLKDTANFELNFLNTIQTMIKKIQFIKQFGIFKDYNWDTTEGIKEFKEKNVIYGWNYSGKTTISRIFSSLHDKQLHDKYKSGEFKIVYDDDNKELTQGDLKTFGFGVQVFNSEFIKQNLKWDMKESLNAISFDVGKNVEIRDEIEKNEERINSIEGTETIIGRKATHQPAIDEFNNFETLKFTNEAKIIKIDIFNSLIEFNKGHLKGIKTQVEADLFAHIITDSTSLGEIKKTALANNDKNEINEIAFMPSVKNIYDSVEAILKAEPPQSEVVEALENDNDMYKWAKEGLKLHSNNGKEICSFCGNGITKNRYGLLNNYFSNASAKLRSEIENCKLLLTNEATALDNINIPKSKNDFTDKCHTDFEDQLEKWREVKKAYKKFLKNLSNELDRKENGNIFNPLTIIEYDLISAEGITNWIADTQKIIDTHNTFVKNFNEEQSEAREKLKKHLVADFLNREKYTEKEKANDYSVECLRKYDCLIGKIKVKNNELWGKLKDVVAGKNELNKFIKTFLNREDINIEVTSDDRFVLRRGNDFAENLSEGEKTAISFAYFLVTLESLHREKKLKETIIFIDDPISSLDANHIAQVYSLINSFFFRKGEDPLQPDAAINCFKQLFISTHNFEFFSFLKDSTQLKKHNSNPNTGCNYYFIQRIGEDNSQLIPLPNSLRLKSEYVYLFQILFRFYKDGCKLEDDSLILMPNALRRFFEIYTLMKLPGSTGEIDSRINLLLGGTHNLKILHHFSHFTTFEKATKHDELIMLLPGAMEELMTLLKSDTTHFESLKRAINES